MFLGFKVARTQAWGFMRLFKVVRVAALGAWGVARRVLRPTGCRVLGSWSRAVGLPMFQMAGEAHVPKS